MAEMALGYGSEYQLLRYMGHHRNYLDSQIKKVTKSESPIEWMDYPVDEHRDSLDGEWTGISFLQHIRFDDYNQISEEWKKFWPQGGRAQSWDGIFQQDGIIYVVEAKAHILEMEQECHAGSESRNIIEKAFEQVTNDSEKAQLWLNSKHYQLANRVAFVHFLNSNGIKAKLCYVMFTNGYLLNATKNVDSEEKFKLAFEEECNKLELGKEERDYIISVVIDAKSDGF